MTEFESNNSCAGSIPVSFRVIGVGADTADLIAKVKSFGYDCVGCCVATAPADCIPAEEDKMAIIVARDAADTANAIARSYHDAGVLTLGLLPGADASCYDSVARDTNSDDYPGIIQTLFRPLATQGYVNFDFNDLCNILGDSGTFTTIVVDGGSVGEVVDKMQQKMARLAVKNITRLSIHLYLNREMQGPVKMGEMKHINDMISRLPEPIDIIWSVSFDNTLPTPFSFTALLAGPGL